jgi:hypothetical protein
MFPKVYATVKILNQNSVRENKSRRPKAPTDRKNKIKLFHVFPEQNVH